MRIGLDAQVLNAAGQSSQRRQGVFGDYVVGVVQPDLGQRGDQRFAAQRPVSGSDRLGCGDQDVPDLQHRVGGRGNG